MCGAPPFLSLMFQVAESNKFHFHTARLTINLHFPNAKNLRDSYRTPPLGKELSMGKDVRCGTSDTQGLPQ